MVKELQDSGLAKKALQPEDVAPDFELPDHNRKLVRSSELLEQGPLVICFVRGRWCPFCVGQLEAMSSIYPELKTRGAGLVAISPQTTHQIVPDG